MAVNPAAPHKNGAVRTRGLRLGRLVEETRPVYVERATGKVKGGEPEYAEIELTAWWYPTVRAEVKAKLRASSDAYQKAIRPDPDDIDPEDGRPRFVPNQEAWEGHIVRSLRLLVPDMTADEAAFLANWGGGSEKALEVLYYLGYWRTNPNAEADAEGAPNPEASTGAST